MSKTAAQMCCGTPIRAVSMSIPSRHTRSSAAKSPSLSVFLQRKYRKVWRTSSTVCSTRGGRMRYRRRSRGWSDLSHFRAFPPPHCVWDARIRYAMRRSATSTVPASRVLRWTSAVARASTGRAAAAEDGTAAVAAEDGPAAGVSESSGVGGGAWSRARTWRLRCCCASRRARVDMVPVARLVQ
jgi:hypothetical protein